MYKFNYIQVSLTSLISLVLNINCKCPSDCETTRYKFEVSVSPRTPNDTALLIKSYNKKNKLLYNVNKAIQNLDSHCITPEVKQKKTQEFKQLNHSIAHSCSVLHFFWKAEAMISYKRDQRYTILDMLSKQFKIQILFKQA